MSTIKHRVQLPGGSYKQTFSQRQRKRGRRGLSLNADDEREEVGSDFRRPFLIDEVQQASTPSSAEEENVIRQFDSIVRQKVKRVLRSTARVGKKLFCGALAGAVSRTATAPVETVKTVMMVSEAKKGPVEVGLMIVKRDGWKGLFRGNAVNVLRVAPSKAIELFAFDTMRKVLMNPDGSATFPLPLPPASVAGACAGLSSTILTYPLEVLKTRLTIEAGKYSGIGDAFRTITRTEGLGALYRGLGASAFGIIPYAATNYYTYDGLRRAYRKLTGNNQVGNVETLFIGSGSGAIAATITFPLEVVRRQLQAGSLNGKAYKGVHDCVMGIYAAQGLKGFYRGWGPSCAKLMPAAGISFCIYEIAKKKLL